MYLKLTNGIPEKYNLGQLRRDNPRTSFPKHISDELLASYDVYPYTRPAKPDYDNLTSGLSDGNFSQDQDGNWSLGYTVTQRDQALAERNVRDYRDGLLKESDWVTLRSMDHGQPIDVNWKQYREDLRNVSDQEGFPFNITWPTKPA
jgi:hypothetical protein